MNTNNFVTPNKNSVEVARTEMHI